MNLKYECRNPKFETIPNLISITGGLITIKGSPSEKSVEIMQNKVKTGENKIFFAPASIFCSFSQIIRLDKHY